MYVQDRDFDFFLSEVEIQKIVKGVAEQISVEMYNKNPIFIGILNGSFMFMADLIRHFSFPLQMNFMRLSSYEGTSSSGKVSELLELDPLLAACKNRHIILVEDIIETGLSIEYTKQKLASFCPLSIKICTLFYKPNSCHREIQIDYLGRTLTDEFIVGYGLDYNQYGRNLRDIYQLRNNS